MIKKVVLIAILVCILVSTAFGRPLTLNEIQHATCRVTAGNGMGTGTCVGEDDHNYYVLTNAHVIGQARNVYLEFFKSGYKTNKLTASVVWKSFYERSDYDFAICAIPKSVFGKHPPRVIHLAPRGYISEPGNYIASMGCPNGHWVQGWEGHVTKDSNSRILFTPAPVGGQSGSGLIMLVRDKTGELHSRVGAVLTWRIGQINAVGGAIPVSQLYKAMGGETSSANQIPVSYRPVSTRETYILGSDGKVYVGKEDLTTGMLYVTLPSGVTSVRHLGPNYKNSNGCPPGGSPNSSGCPPGGCPPGDMCPPSRTPWQPFGGILNPRPDPYSPPSAPAPSNPSNPYGNIDPPDIAPSWPVPETEPSQPIPVPETPETVSDDEEPQLGFFGRLRERMSGFAGGLMMGIGIGLLSLIWNKFIRKRLVIGIDNVQDLIQGKIGKKYGYDAGVKSRDLMEGVEESLLGFFDDFFNKEKSQQKIERAKLRGKLASRVTNGERPIRGSAREAIDVLKALADDPAEKTVDIETVKKVMSLLDKLPE